MIEFGHLNHSNNFNDQVENDGLSNRLIRFHVSAIRTLVCGQHLGDFEETLTLRLMTVWKAAV